jgi:hypothetical protein
MEFIYNQDIKPVQSNFINYDNFNEKILKSSKDLNESNENFKDLITGLEITLKTSKLKSNEKVEKYRVEWKNSYENYHQGYMWYLYSAYMSDAGIEIAPWYLYNVIFHQIAQVIKDNSEEFRNIFTTSQEKIIIKMYTPDLDINLYTGVIKNLIPNPDTFDMFFPSWTETPVYYNESLQGLFADMVQKYYGACIMGCSCPKVRVKGTQEDWDKLVITIENLLQLFKSNGASSLNGYLQQVIIYLKKIQYTWNIKETWERFFFVGNCGSGHQECICGDCRNLLTYSIENEMLIGSLPNTLCRFPFEYVPDPKQKESYFIGGMIGSNLDESGFLVPQYDYAITWIDKEASLLSNDQNLKFNELLTQLYKWDRISASGNNLLNHFNANSSSYKSQLNYSDYLNKYDLEVIDKGDESVITEYLDKIYKNALTRWNNGGKELAQAGFIQAGFINGMEPTLEGIKNDFDKKKSNGNINDKVELDEKIRLEKIIKPDTNFSHLWFEGIYKIEPKFNSWTLNKSSICLTLDQYKKQLTKVNLYCLELSNHEYLKNLIYNINNYKKLFGTQTDPGDIIIGTLNPLVMRLYYLLYQDSAKELIKYFILDELSLLKKVNSGTKLNTNINRKNIFKLDQELKDDLLIKYMEEFIIEIKEIINQMIKEYEEKIEILNVKLNKCTQDYMKKYYIDDIERNKLNIIDLTNIIVYIVTYN